MFCGDFCRTVVTSVGQDLRAWDVQWPLLALSQFKGKRFCVSPKTCSFFVSPNLDAWHPWEESHMHFKWNLFSLDFSSLFSLEKNHLEPKKHSPRFSQVEAWGSQCWINTLFLVCYCWDLISSSISTVQIRPSLVHGFLMFFAHTWCCSAACFAGSNCCHHHNHRTSPSFHHDPQSKNTSPPNSIQSPKFPPKKKHTKHLSTNNWFAPHQPSVWQRLSPWSIAWQFPRPVRVVLDQRP